MDELENILSSLNVNEIDEKYELINSIKTINCIEINTDSTEDTEGMNMDIDKQSIDIDKQSIDIDKIKYNKKNIQKTIRRYNRYINSIEIWEIRHQNKIFCKKYIKTAILNFLIFSKNIDYNDSIKNINECLEIIHFIDNELFNILKLLNAWENFS